MRSILDAYRAAFSGLPRDVWWLSAVALVNRAGTMVVPFLALYLTQRQGLSPSRAGWVLAVYAGGGVVGAYVGGRLTDRVGAIRTQRLSLIGSGFGFLALAAARGLPALVVVAFFVGVVAESFRPANLSAIASRVEPGMEGRAFALLRLAVNVGMSLGPGLGGLIALWSYTWLFVIDAATCWLAALLLVRVGRRLGETEDEAGQHPGANRSPWTDGPFLLLLLLSFGIGAVFFQIVSTFPLTLRDVYALHEGFIGGLLAFNALVIAAFEMLLIHRAEKREPLMLVGLGAFLVCVGFGMMPLGTTLGFAALTVLVWTFGEMLCLPLLSAVVVRRAGPGNKGRYLGAYMVAFGLAFVVAPPVGTSIYEHLGPQALWFGVAALGPLLWIGLAALRSAFGSAPPGHVADRVA